MAFFIIAVTGTNVIQSDERLSLNYFLADGSKLEKIEPGEIYITEGKAEKIEKEMEVLSHGET